MNNDLPRDLKRAKEILERGKAEPPDLPMPEHVHFGGTIYGADIYPAYLLLEHFVSELTQFLGLFSDYEEPCESFEQAQAIWNQMKARENQLHDALREARQQNGENLVVIEELRAEITRRQRIAKRLDRGGPPIDAD